MSLRVRLALIYVLLAAPALGVFAVAVYLVAHDRVYESVDRTLENRADVVISSLAHVDPSLSESDIALSSAALDRLAVAGDAFTLYDTEGQPLYSSVGADGLVALVPPGGTRFDVSDDADGHRQRLLVAPIVRFGSTAGYVEVQTSLQQADTTLSDLKWTIVFGGIAAAVIVAVPAYALSRKALEPVSRAAALAREIEETGDFGRRMPEVRGRGDLAELTHTLNSLIQRVDEMMKAQRAFLADSSHELRRPLTIIRTNIDVMNDPRLTKAERQTIELEMREEAQSMSRLISDLHLLAREQVVEAHRAPFDLSRVCNGALESTARRFSATHHFEAEIASGVEFIGDADQIERAILNLLENACTYTPADGTVRLVLRRGEFAAQIIVSDTGVGMSEADASRVFERFYRAKGSQAIKPDGFGLGLAIVKQIAEAHEGRVRLSSTLGAGSSFCIELPLPAPIVSLSS